MISSPTLPALASQKITLNNGLDVIALRRDHLPIVAVNLWYHVGSKNENRSRRGFAHLFEHLMFEGSEHYPGDFFQPLQRLGAGVNGSTSSDRTNYFEDLPAAHFELALAMESDRMGNLLPALTDQKIRVQKDVVKNEYRQNYANRPYGQAWRVMAEALYPPQHPYSWLTIGAMEDVEAAAREDIEDFFGRFYVPANAGLALVGDLDPDRAFALAERYFGPIPGGSRSMRPWTPEVTLGADVEIRLNDRVELDRLYCAWHTVPHFHDDDAALVILADLLTRGRSSRLYRKLVVDREIVQDVTAYQSARELAGSFGVVATIRPGRSWAEARDLIDREIADLAQTGAESAELERARNSRVAGFIYALDNVGGFGGVADRLNAYNLYLNDPDRITTDVNRYQQVTGADVARVAKDYLAVKPRVSLLVQSRGTASTATPLDRSVRPASASAVSYKAPIPEVRTLSNGATLWVVPRRDLPIVAATAVVPAGAGAHGPERGGLAALTASMLDEGTKTRDSLSLALEIEKLGASLTSSSGWDGSYAAIQCLTPHLEAALDVCCDVLVNPTFPEVEWNRVRGQTLAALRAERDGAESLAARGLLRALYGDDHPYRVPIDGAEATVGRLEPSDARAFHLDRYRPERAAWVVAGDVDADAVVRLLDSRLENWSGKTGPLPEIDRPADATKNRLILIHRPGSAQAVLRLGQIGERRQIDDHADLVVLNQILGGQFVSRLNAKLREEKGFTYGARSHFDFRRAAGPFVVSASIQSDRVAEALSDAFLEIEALLVDRPPTSLELDDARRSLIEGQARQFETPAALVSRYANLFIHDLPADYHAQMPERLAGVTLSSLSAAGLRSIRPSSLVAVVVADSAAVRPSLERLGWADLEVFETTEEIDRRD